jgi:hypothetical protein
MATQCICTLVNSVDDCANAVNHIGLMPIHFAASIETDIDDVLMKNIGKNCYLMEAAKLAGLRVICVLAT